MNQLLFKMLLWLLFLASAISSPADEFRGFINEGELTLDDATYLMRIIPSGYSPQKFQNNFKMKLSDIIDENNEYYEKFNQYVEKGSTMKGLTFNVYDDNIRGASIALFRMLQSVEPEKLHVIKEWARQNINDDIFEYAWRLASLYSIKNFNELDPPFIAKPNYFVNSETISKALRLKINNGIFNPDDAKINQFFRTDDVISINTNYSGWNLAQGGCEEEINYFREDIALNSYYYGMHLLHPFWMSNDELDEIDPRHAEHYYYVHQQLMARYLLEKEHLKLMHYFSNKTCDSFYNPHLTYENGLPFPIRSLVTGKWNSERTRLKAVDIALRECISRGIIIMENGTAISMTEHNHIDLLAKLIRANFDGENTAKTVRFVYGYGANGYPINEYNPAPSVLHHPETSLRDPIYWYLIQCLLNYFTEYKNLMEPYDLTKDLTDKISIKSVNFTKIVTYFKHYQFNLEQSFNNENHNYLKSSFVIAARQKRLTHLPFVIYFNVNSKNEENVTIRLFLGPQCSDCWQEYSKFYELDIFDYTLKEGTNILNWSPNISSRYSYDDYFNLETTPIKQYKYDLFKFPENLLIPKGLEDGLNLTLFIIITPTEHILQTDLKPDKHFYKHLLYNTDKKPFGFPFHRRISITENYTNMQKNFVFCNITIYHKKNNVHHNSDYNFFSPYLY